jgi:prepilin-type N-terminal cleavage/methylation domain-containing protein
VSFLRLEGGRDARARSGFTLVEVIVVIVIIAILAAIGVPALTGYIDKARDKEYIAQARDLSVATHSVIAEAYGKGELDTSAAVAYASPSGGSTQSGFKQYDMSALWSHASGTGTDYNNQIAALVGRTFAGGLNIPGAYRLFLRGPVGGDLFDADGFVYTFAPQGNWGDPSVIVTYKMTRASGANGTAVANAIDTSVQYDANAGFEVYYISYS